jgi:hypothetical protein
LFSQIVLDIDIFTRESLQSSAARGYTSCFVVVAVVAACLLVLYSMKQFENLPLHCSISATHAYSLVSCHYSSATAAACMQFGILPLQQCNSRRMHAVWYPAPTAVQQPPRACRLVSCDCRALVYMQFVKLPLQQGVDVPTHAV